jgi:hypothetical protein
MQVVCQSRLCTADHVYLTYLMLQRQLSHLNATEFKPHIFSMPGFTLSFIANMFILVILYAFCLLPAHFCYAVVYIWKVDSCMQITDWCAPWKISSGMENLVLQAVQF